MCPGSEVPPSLRARLGDAGLARVKEHFSEERIVELWIKIYKKSAVSN